jgi:hypothetical protein
MLCGLREFINLFALSPQLQTQTRQCCCPPEEWDYLDVDVLRPARSGAVHHLPALPLRDRQALRHRAHLSDSPGSDSPGRALDQAVLSVGGTAGGSGGVVS